MRTPRLLVVLLAAALIGGACGSSGTDSTSAPGVRVVNATDAAAIQAEPPNDLVILDVRTPEEFAEGHLDGATMIDFYRDDFAEQLEELDPDAPYLLYCRSGNRSGQAADIMRELGFTDVADIDGGILAWYDLDLPTVQP